MICRDHAEKSVTSIRDFYSFQLALLSIDMEDNSRTPVRNEFLEYHVSLLIQRIDFLPRDIQHIGFRRLADKIWAFPPDQQSRLLIALTGKIGMIQSREQLSAVEKAADMIATLPQALQGELLVVLANQIKQMRDNEFASFRKITALITQLPLTMQGAPLTDIIHCIPELPDHERYQAFTDIKEWIGRLPSDQQCKPLAALASQIAYVPPPSRLHLVEELANTIEQLTDQQYTLLKAEIFRVSEFSSDSTGRYQTFIDSANAVATRSPDQQAPALRELAHEINWLPLEGRYQAWMYMANLIAQLPREWQAPPLENLICQISTLPANMIPQAQEYSARLTTSLLPEQQIDPWFALVAQAMLDINLADYSFADWRRFAPQLPPDQEDRLMLRIGTMLADQLEVEKPRSKYPAERQRAEAGFEKFPGPDAILKSPVGMVNPILQVPRAYQSALWTALANQIESAQPLWRFPLFTSIINAVEELDILHQDEPLAALARAIDALRYPIQIDALRVAFERIASAVGRLPIEQQVNPTHYLLNVIDTFETVTRCHAITRIAEVVAPWPRKHQVRPVLSLVILKGFAEMKDRCYRERWPHKFWG